MHPERLLRMITTACVMAMVAKSCRMLRCHRCQAEETGDHWLVLTCKAPGELLLLLLNWVKTPCIPSHPIASGVRLHLFISSLGLSHAILDFVAPDFVHTCLSARTHALRPYPNTARAVDPLFRAWSVLREPLRARWLLECHQPPWLQTVPFYSSWASPSPIISISSIGG
jgi:hypothetical protein